VQTRTEHSLRLAYGPPHARTQIITGFLGSGKTTLVNRILAGTHGKRIAVIENEFGEVGVDDALVIQLQNEELLELNNGWCADVCSSSAR
jgi:G3E family GTPase